MNSNVIPATENALAPAGLKLLTPLVNEIFFTYPRVFLLLEIECIGRTKIGGILWSFFFSKTH